MTYLVTNTPLEDRLALHGLLVKREDLSCPPPGPPFSKTRGVLAHMVRRIREHGTHTFGVLDTSHSQGGLAVAHAAHHLGVKCLDFYPVYKGQEGLPLRPVQAQAKVLGAEVLGLKAGRSAILYHTAKRMTEGRDGYMMPNALKLSEMVEETALEVGRTIASAPAGWRLDELPWLVSCSSGTIAAGVLKGVCEAFSAPPPLILHLGYSRSHDAVRAYVLDRSGKPEHAAHLTIIDECYNYADKASPGPSPTWPCNEHYDLKAYRWWASVGRQRHGEALLWNIG